MVGRGGYQNSPEKVPYGKFWKIHCNFYVLGSINGDESFWPQSPCRHPLLVFKIMIENKSGGRLENLFLCHAFITADVKSSY